MAISELWLSEYETIPEYNRRIHQVTIRDSNRTALYMVQTNEYNSAFTTWDFGNDDLADNETLMARVPRKLGFWHKLLFYKIF